MKINSHFYTVHYQESYHICFISSSSRSSSTSSSSIDDFGIHAQSFLIEALLLGLHFVLALQHNQLDDKLDPGICCT